MARNRAAAKVAEKAATKKAAKPAKADKASGSGPIAFESTLWAAADKLRNNMDAAEYKHVVLGLLFLKFISDAFEEHHALLSSPAKKKEGYDPEDQDEYRAENIFWVPKEARWSHLQKKAKTPGIGKDIDDAMRAIEKDNPKLKSVLPKEYANPRLDKQKLGELIDLFSGLNLGDKKHREEDLIGRVYEYFLSNFASAEGKQGGQFYTPRSVVKTLVAMLAPYKGRVYDPCCGSGGMFVQSEKFIEAHGGQRTDVSIYGQESNPTTWRLAQMNLAIRGIEANFGETHADTFARDLHRDLKFDYVLANPPFNDSDWGSEHHKNDVRWKYGTPPTGNANYAWIQHFIHHLAPTGIAGFVLANGSMSTQQSGEGDIRRKIIEADLVDCMVAMPGQLFFSTQIPVCLWFLSKDKSNGLGGRGKKLRNRSKSTLFIDARALGTLVSRTQRELSEHEIGRIADTYHNWRGDGPGKYEDIPGFCHAATTSEIEAQGFVLTPGRYVGAAEKEDDSEPFETLFPKLVAQLEEQFAEGRKLEQQIMANLKGML